MPVRAIVLMVVIICIVAFFYRNEITNSFHKTNNNKENKE